MAMERNLSIFISWADVLALECAKVLYEWLPKMFDHVDPWMSDSSIEAGERSMDEIQSQLKESGFGIIVVTTENMERMWLNFEAGALSKSFGDDKTRVVPLLVNFKDKFQLKGPIAQFHAVMLDKEGARKLCESIARTIGLGRDKVRDRFEWAWPELQAGIDNAKQIAGAQPELPEVDDTELLKNVYSILRGMQEQQQTRSEERVGLPTIGSVRSSFERTGSDIDLSKVLHDVSDVASQVKPIKTVMIRQDPDGEFVVVVSFEGGERLTKAEHSLLRRRLAAVTPYRLVITQG